MLSIDEVQLTPQVRLARMVVFVPDSLANVADFARQIYWLAVTQQREVVYLALNNRDSDELAAERLLASLTALTQDKTVNACAMQVCAESRAEALRLVAHPGDMVIWPEARESSPASLERELGVSVQVLPGIYDSAEHGAPWYRTVLCWLSMLFILAGFTFLEFRLAPMLGGSLKKVVLIILIGVELAVLYQWDRIFG